MLYVISTLSYDTSLLPHFFKYYKSLGVTRFIISIHELVPGLLKKAQAIAKQFDSDVKWIPVSERQILTGIEGNNKEEIREKHVTSQDWIIPADLDEFIQFPAPISQLIGEMDANGATFIKGDFLDRISEDGRLNPTLPEPSIWEQFPLTCKVSQSLIKCWSHKVTLARGDCMLASGHHNVIFPARPHISRRCIIHHFKWRRGLLTALRRRLAVYKNAGWDCYREAERALSYLNQNRRINVVDFRAARGWNPDVNGLPRSSVIYTSITNSFDDLKMIPHLFRGNADAVAFVDQPVESASWRVLPACTDFSDPCRNAKRPKILPHLYFGDIQYSLWIDGSISIISDMTLDQMIDEYLSERDIAVFRHRGRICAYDEAEMCVRSRKDNAISIRQQMARYEYENYPKRRGLAECCVILRRHTPKVRLLNEVWWDEICRHSRRDQLSFDFVCWKLGVKYDRFAGNITANRYFRICRHKSFGAATPAPSYRSAAVGDGLRTFLSAGLRKPGCRQNLSPRGRRTSLAHNLEELPPTPIDATVCQPPSECVLQVNGKRNMETNLLDTAAIKVDRSGGLASITL
jgi:hypothetical protein